MQNKTKKIKIVLFIIILFIIISLTLLLLINKNETIVKVTQVATKKATTVKEINVTPEIVNANSLKQYERLIGRYQFNAIGAGNGVAYDYTTRLKAGNSHVPECADYEGTSSEAKNSSGAYLDNKYNVGGKIYKAYLMVETTYNWDGIQLNNYPITFLYGGNDGAVKTGIKSKVNILNVSNIDNKQRESGIIDVTEFVKENGYGWYYCCNIPYTDLEMWDCYASWKLIVIEENDKLPIRLLKLDIGNCITSRSETNLEVSEKYLYTKKQGQVTGQFLFSIAGTDIGNGSILYSKTGSSSDLEKIVTKNNTRTEARPLVLRMLRNGRQIQQKIQYTNPIYAKDSLMGYTKDSDDYYLLQGSDLDLFDFDDTSNHNISIEQGINKILLKVEAKTVSSTSALGLVVDLDVPTYEGKQETIVHTDKLATVEGKTINISESENTGIANGKFVVKLDEALQADKVTATVYDGKNSLKQIIGTIDNENHTVTFTDVDSYKKGAYIEYKIDCTITDDEKENYKNSDELSGKLHIEETTTDIELEDISTSNSQAKAKRKLTIKPNTGTWKGSKEDTVLYIEYDEEVKLESPIKEEYKFNNWTCVEENKIMDSASFKMGMKNRTLIANWLMTEKEETPTPPSNEAPGVLPQTGEGMEIGISLILIAIIGTISFIKFKKLP